MNHTVEDARNINLNTNAENNVVEGGEIRKISNRPDAAPTFGDAMTLMALVPGRRDHTTARAPSMAASAVTNHSALPPDRANGAR